MPWPKGRSRSEETKQKMSKSTSRVPKVPSELRNRRISEAKTGQKTGPMSLEHRLACSRGKGGTEEHEDRIRLKVWSEQVRQRDDFTCQECGFRDVGHGTVAHHVDRHEYLDRRYDVDNGKTLCRPHHSTEHNAQHAQFDKWRVE